LLRLHYHNLGSQEESFFSRGERLSRLEIGKQRRQGGKQTTDLKDVSIVLEGSAYIWKEGGICASNRTAKVGKIFMPVFSFDQWL
jgi:hypothetical protein